MQALLGYFTNASTQVVILFILIAVGFILTKLKLLNSVGAKQMTDLVIYFVTPAVILKAFIGGEVIYSSQSLTRLLIAGGAAIFTHLVAFLIGLIFVGTDKSARGGIHAAVVLMSNGGFMAIPLTDAILGSEGVFMVVVYVGIFNIVSWTLGVKLLTTQKMSFKKAFLNPGVIPAVAGIVLFLLRVDISSVKIAIEPIRYLAALNTPLPMAIIGFYLANAGLKPQKGDGNMYLAISMRLVAVPLVTMFALRLLGLTGLPLTACVIPASAPAAALVMMLSAKYGGDAQYASRIVSVSHILSVISMPLILTLCKYIGG